MEWQCHKSCLWTNLNGLKIFLNLMKVLYKNYNEKGDKGYFLEVDAQYPEKWHNLHNDLPFLPEKMKTENVKKLLAELHDKTEYVMHIRNLKEALNFGLVLKKLRRTIKFK